MPRLLNRYRGPPKTTFARIDGRPPIGRTSDVKMKWGGGGRATREPRAPGSLSIRRDCALRVEHVPNHDPRAVVDERLGFRGALTTRTHTRIKGFSFGDDPSA